LLPEAAAVPEVPKTFKPLDGVARQTLLKVYADQRAETDNAVKELWTKRAEIAEDLGSLAPDPETAKALLEQMMATRELNRKAQALAAYADEQEALANHAVMTHLYSVVADIEHMATRKPGIKEHYSEVLAVTEQRREAIVAGMARSKAAKPAETPPA
jgi:hypothetical protein